MIDCVWIPLENRDGMWTCEACNEPYTLKFKTPERPKARRNCRGKKITEPCANLGDQLSTEQCDSCQGTVKIKTFACAVHGRCTLGKKLPEIACCQGCGDYRTRG